MCNADKKATISSGDRVLDIEINPGFSLPQILALLNLHEALIEDGEIIAFTAAHHDAAYAMCRVTTDTGGPLGTKWSEYDAAAAESAGSGCPCGGSCPCH